MALAGQTPLTVYSLEQCSFGTKKAEHTVASSNSEKLEQLKDRFKSGGLIHNVEAALIVHFHGHPHVLLLQPNDSSFTLPGGRLNPGEDDIEGLKRELANLLSPDAAVLAFEWQIGDCLATYWRPHFAPEIFPYLPVHVTQPKELTKVFVVHLPERCYFAVPGDLKLVAIPMYDCYQGSAKFGSVIAALPHLLSRLQITCVGS